MGKHYSSKEELVIPHEETRRKQRAIVLRLSLYMLPYVLVGIVELMYWYGTAVTSTFLDGSNLAYIFFNSFVFNIIVPLKGFLNGRKFGHIQLITVSSCIYSWISCYQKFFEIFGEGWVV